MPVVWHLASRFREHGIPVRPAQEITRLSTRPRRVGYDAPSIMLRRATQRPGGKADRKRSRRLGEFAEMLPVGRLWQSRFTEAQDQFIRTRLIECLPGINEREPDEVGMVDIAL